jgi:hypothetical protein
MRLPGLAAIGVTLCLCALLAGQESVSRPKLLPPVAHQTNVGFLHAAADPARAIAYEPQPGDLVLYDDSKPFRHLLFKLSGTAPPTHAAMVIADRTGKPALLELTGPTIISAKVQIMNVEDRFNSYPGYILVRRIRQPMHAAQRCELTRFAEAQVGKGFALPRVFLQGTPFCARIGLRQALFGKTYYDRNRWFCSEMVVAACCKAQLFDSRVLHANATLPRDLAFDETIDLSPLYHPAALWRPAK